MWINEAAEWLKHSDKIWKYKYLLCSRLRQLTRERCFPEQSTSETKKQSRQQRASLHLKDDSADRKIREVAGHTKKMLLKAEDANKAAKDHIQEND